ncbi:uncharacterized protein PFL1_05194 [Pseudozyma flocculosa PF-1]|uniref:Conserved oligomeric Golgi complex subunit 7 n=2 Tax=Pseudozyma flocculosa TaxID=84751 RepID=A0A5C3F5J4_9BASI|nr:uncharacterized protein PFL1_05194 [Pseudozyma flocculosa PF-1]EPQ27271.1 hypothetical protein PFL1_05194 [Pseudozyma flocculosa PF-1]SPO39642.1 uncharacterized protein PSFLO_05123 [Pseudozyma flocculosa]
MDPGPSSPVAPAVSPSSTASALDRLHRIAALPTDAHLAAWLNDHLAHHASSSPHPSTSQTQAQTLTTTADALRTVSIAIASQRESARSDIQLLIDRLVDIIPKLGLDLNITAQAAKKLQSHIDAAKSALVQPQTSQRPPQADDTHSDDARDPPSASVDHALARIRTLSHLNQSLVTTRNSLREAQAWSTLESHVTSSFSEHRWSEAVDRITKARDSLNLFRAGPETSPSNDRVQLLERLTDAIQQHLVPILERSIKDRDVETTTKLAHLLNRVGRRESGFGQTYLATRRQDTLLHWAQRNADVPDSAAAASALPLLNSLFADVLGMLGEERIYADKIFHRPRQAAEFLLAALFDGLEPSLHEYLQRFASLDDVEHQLAAVTKAYQSVEGASKSIADMLPTDEAARAAGPPDDVDATSMPPVDALDIAAIPLAATALPWQDALLLPFLEWQTSFATLEARAMATRLQAAQLATGVGTDRAQHLRELVSSAIEAAGTSARRSRTLTRGYATGPLIERVEALLCSILDSQKRDLVSYGQAVVDRIAERGRQREQASTTTTSYRSYDDREEDLTTEDWEDFQRGTHVLAACRDVVSRIAALEATLAGQLVEVGALLPAKTYEDLRSSSEEGAISHIDASKDDTANDSTNNRNGDGLSPLDRSPLNSRLLRHWIDLASRFLSSSARPNASSIAHLVGSTTTSHRELKLFAQTHSRILMLARTTQKYLHDVLLAPFTPALSAYVTLPLWTATRHPSAVNEYDLTMPQFSLSPTDTVSRIGEGLLNLPRLVEVYAEEEWLAFPPAADPLVDGKDERGEVAASDADRGGKPGAGTEATAAETHRRMHRQAFSTTSLPPASDLVSAPTPAASTANGTSSPSDRQDNAPGTRTREATLSLFLSALLSSFLSHLFGTVLPSLPRLSEVGANQLATDLDYLVNICAALNDRDSQARIQAWRKVCALTHQDGLEIARCGGGVSDAETSGIMQREDEEAWKVIARLRGWLA